MKNQKKTIEELFRKAMSLGVEGMEMRAKGDRVKARRCEDEAMDVYDEVLAMEPLNLQAIGCKAVNMAQNGFAIEAIPMLEKAIQLDPPGWHENHRQLGLCYAEIDGDLQKARAYTFRSLELDKRADRKRTAGDLHSIAESIVKLAHRHGESGRYPEEQRYYRHARGVMTIVLEIEPGHARASQGIADIDRKLASRARASR